MVAVWCLMPSRFPRPLLLLALLGTACDPSPKHRDPGDDDAGSDAGPDGGQLPDCPAELTSVASDLRINEALSDNDGVGVDELGETDDYVELYNSGAKPIALTDYRLRDSSNASV